LFRWSRERDLGRVRRVDDATLCGPPWNEPAYEARDILSDAAANDVRDCLSSDVENYNQLVGMLRKRKPKGRRTWS
jgi:hypothetical protein